MWTSQHLARRHSNDSVVICGSDSDILLQAITLCAKIPNIAVLQVLPKIILLYANHHNFNAYTRFYYAYYYPPSRPTLT